MSQLNEKKYILQKKQAAAPLQFGALAALATGEALTLEVWCCFGDTLADGVLLALHADPAQPLQLAVQGGKLCCQQGSAGPAMVAATPVKAGKWLHVALVADANAKMLSLFVNGYGAAKGNAATLAINAGAPLTLGENFAGAFAFVAVWNSDQTARVKGADRFRLPEKNEAGLARAWTFEQNGSSPILDINGAQSLNLAPGWQWVAAAGLPTAGKLDSQASALASRLTQRNNQNIAQAKVDAHESLQRAHAKAAAANAQAHRQAAATALASKFDNIYHLYGGALRTVDARGNTRFLVSEKLNDVAIHLEQKSLYTCGSLSRLDGRGIQSQIAAWNLDGSPLRTVYDNRPNPIHSLTVDGTINTDNASLYWIEGDGLIMRGAINGTSPAQLYQATGGGKQWQLALDPQNQMLYWTNGSEIWFGQVSGNSLTGVDILVPNAESPSPIDLDYDSDSGVLCWVDSQLGAVCRVKNGRNIKTLYAAPHPRRGLVVDDALDAIYWNADYTEEVHATVIDEPGLLLTLQDQQPTKQPIHVHLVGAVWLPPAAGSSPDPAGEITPLLQKNVLFFDGQDDYVDLGALKINWRKGLTIKTWIKINDDAKDGARILDLSNGPDKDNIILAVSKNDDKLALRFAIHENDSKDLDARIGAIEADLSANQWYFITAVVDPKGTGHLYVNTLEVKTAGLYLPRNVLRNQNYIGRSDTSNFFSGEIAMLRLSNKARSVKDIQLAYPQLMFRSEFAIPEIRPPKPLIFLQNNITVVGQGIQQPVLSGATWQEADKGSQPDRANKIAPLLKEKVLFFDGKDDYIDLGPLEIDWKDGLTVEVWVNFKKRTSGSRIFYLGNGGMHYEGITMQLDLVFDEEIHESRHLLEFRASYWYSVNTIDIYDNEWVYLAGVIDKDGWARIWVNHRWGDSYRPGGYAIGRPINVKRTKNYIGFNFGESRFDFPFLQGEIAMFRLWNAPLSSGALSAYYQDPQTVGQAIYENMVHPITKIKQAGLLIMLQHNQSVANQPISYELVGPVWQKPMDRSVLDPQKQVSSLLASNVLSFDGKDDYIDLGALEIDWSKGLTLEAWIMFNQAKDWMRIVELGDGSGKDDIILALRSDSNGVKLVLLTHDDGKADNRQVETTPDAVALNQWYYIAAVIEPNGTGHIYLNAVENNQKPLYLPTTKNRTKSLIGRSVYDLPFFSGEIAMLRLWNQALDDQTIKAYYRIDSQPPMPPAEFAPYKDEWLPYRTCPYLMRGSINGDLPAEPLFPLAIEGGLALASKTEQAFQDRIAAYRQRQQAAAEAAQRLAAAREQAAATIQAAHQSHDELHDKAQQTLAAAQANATQQRADAQQRLQNASVQAQQKLTIAQADAQKTKEDAQQKAQAIKQNAQNQHDKTVSDAQADLARAREERAKH